MPSLSDQALTPSNTELQAQSNTVASCPLQNEQTVAQDRTLSADSPLSETSSQASIDLPSQADDDDTLEEVASLELGKSDPKNLERWAREQANITPETFDTVQRNQLVKDIEADLKQLSEPAYNGAKPMLSTLKWIAPVFFTLFVTMYITCRRLFAQQSAEEIREDRELCQHYGVDAPCRPAVIIVLLALLCVILSCCSLIPMVGNVSRRAFPIAIFAVSKELEKAHARCKKAINGALMGIEKQLCQNVNKGFQAFYSMGHRILHDHQIHKNRMSGNEKKSTSKRAQSKITSKTENHIKLLHNEAGLPAFLSAEQQAEFYANTARVDELLKQNTPQNEPKKPGGTESQSQKYFEDVRKQGFRDAAYVTAQAVADRPYAKLSKLFIAAQKTSLSMERCEDSFQGWITQQFKDQVAGYVIACEPVPGYQSGNQTGPDRPFSAKMLDPAKRSLVTQPLHFQGGIPAVAAVDVCFDHLIGKLSRRDACACFAEHGLTMSPTSFDKLVSTMIFSGVLPLHSGLKVINREENTEHGVDETFIPMQIPLLDAMGAPMPGHKSSQTYYVAVVVTCPNSVVPCVFFVHSKSRSRKDIEEAIKDYLPEGGTMVTDRFADYPEIAKNKGSAHQFCGSHAYCRNYNAIAEVVESSQAKEVELIEKFKAKRQLGEKFELTPEEQNQLIQARKELAANFNDDVKAMFACCICFQKIFSVEHICDQYREQVRHKSQTLKRTGKLSKEERQEVNDYIAKRRQEHSRYFVALLVDLMTQLQTSKNPDYVKVANYWLNGLKEFKTFLDNPEIPFHNNAAERMMKVFAALRRAHKFTQSPEKAELFCIFQSCYQTLLALGYTEDSMKRMILHTLDLRFKHVMERRVEEQYTVFGDDSRLQNSIYNLNHLSYYDLFPAQKIIFDFLRQERSRLKDKGIKVQALPGRTVAKIISAERERVDKATRAYFLTLEQLRDWLITKERPAPDVLAS